jgi:hypothetical protein
MKPILKQINTLGDLSPVNWALRPASFAVDLVSDLLTL